MLQKTRICDIITLYGKSNLRNGVVFMSYRQVKFRKSMSGYNKEDVNRYIEEMNAKCCDIEFNSKKKNAELENKIKELEQKNKELEEKNKELEDSKRDENNTEKQMSEMLISELNGTIEKLNCEKDELIKENEQLKYSITEYEKIKEANSDIFEKSSKYDRVSEQIGSMIVNANARAESIVSEAELKAKLNATAMIEEVTAKLQTINEKYINEITTKTVQMTDELRNLSLSADEFRASTKESLESEYAELTALIENKKKTIIGEIND